MENKGQKQRITPVRPQDWPVIEKMFAATFQTDIYFPLMKRRLEFARIVSHFSKRLTALFAGDVYLSWSDTIPTGFIMLKRIGKKIHLHYLAIAPEFRRQGLGRELTDFAIKVACENGADIFLETKAGSPASKLYSSLGFTVDNEFYIYNLVSPTAWAGVDTADARLRAAGDAKGLLTVMKEWLLSYKSSSLIYSGEEEIPLRFYVSQSLIGGAAIIHCSLGGGNNELLYQSLPSLALRVRSQGGAYLILTGNGQGKLASPWLRDRIDYITMIKKHQS